MLAILTRPLSTALRAMSTTTAPFGSWKSPITADIITQDSSRGLARKQVGTDGRSKVYWTETRFSEAGRSAFCQATSAEGSSSLRELAPNLNARTRAHEYGGGEFVVDGASETAYVSNFADNRIYAVATDQRKVGPKVVSPDDDHLRFADAVLGNEGLYAVCEDHTGVGVGEQKEPMNYLVYLRLDGTCKVDVVASGADFYSSPCLSPNGDRLVWVQWNHPNMPWDDTEIWTIELDKATGRVKKGVHPAAVLNRPQTSYIRPTFKSPTELLFISDETNWWNLYSLDLSTKLQSNLHKVDKEIGGGPPWQFGQLGYVLTKSGDIVLVVDGQLGVLRNGQFDKLQTGYTSHAELGYLADIDSVACSAGACDKASAIIAVDLKTKQVTVLRLAIDDTGFLEGYLSVPKHIVFPTSADSAASEAHGYYYPPQNKDYSPEQGTLPPLVIKLHGGPTGQTTQNLQLSLQFYTSRGFAVLDLDYRGSSGYGRAYRKLLAGNWGVFEVDDIEACARYLVKEKLADGTKLCVTGGSAGGYSVLAALAFKDVFSAGASHYGVGDLGALCDDTHKFEARYLDGLVAPWPAHKQVYEARSPLNSVDKLSCPVIFFQGTDDKIVPPNQAEAMYSALLKKGVPTALLMFEGEGHGFRAAVNVKKALNYELHFFRTVLGIPSDDKCDLEIKNLKN